MPFETGKVEEIFKNDIMNPKTGRPFSVYLAKINGVNYECGYKMPTFKIGDNVSVEYETQYGKRKIKSAGAPSASAPRSTTSSSNRTFPVGIESPEMSIIRQSALKAAVDLLKGENDLTDEQLAERVISMAYKFADFSSGQREVKMVEDSNE